MVEDQSRKFFSNRYYICDYHLMKCKNGTIWKLYVVQRQGTNVESLREKAKLTLNFKKTNQNCRPIEFTKYIKSVRSLQLEEHLKYKNYKYVSQFMLQITIQSK